MYLTGSKLYLENVYLTGCKYLKNVYLTGSKLYLENIYLTESTYLENVYLAKSSYFIPRNVEITRNKNIFRMCT